MAMPRQIGTFEILERLGAGGMGEVFKARDGRLNRLVAIKVLPEAASATARERFQREALAIAALNHPNICTLHEAGEYEDQPYLVMELLEGETLHARLARGAIALPQIVQWGSEIADALQAAHGKGILHRDLKPGNIFVTQRGTVKVLDFGLAQFAAPASSDSDAATISAAGPALAPLTNPGTALGTYAYMSPEQARGEATDARSDIFSCGVVLYEMAGRRPPFRGRTSADLSAAILTFTAPPPSTLRPEIPPRLDDIVGQCLEKDPDLRYQAAADLKVSLRRLAGSQAPSTQSGEANLVTAGAAPGSSPGSRAASSVASAIVAPRLSWLWPVVAALVIAGGAGAWWMLRPRAEAAVDLAFRQLTFSGAVRDAAISPDGKFLAHVDASPEGASLRLMSVANGSDTQVVAAAAGCCSAPSFSPDGSTIDFVENGDLMTVPVLGGAVRTLAQHVCSGAGFSPDGSQITYILPTIVGSALWVARSDGSQARMLSDPRPAGYNSTCWLGGPINPDAPAWSPDGRWIAVDKGGAGQDNSNQLVLVSVGDGSVRALGAPRQVTASNFAWMPDGSGVLLSTSIPFTAPPQLWEITYPGGKAMQLTHDLQGYTRATFASQAGGSVAMVHSNPQFSVWMQGKPGGEYTQLPGGGNNQDGAAGVVWTADGEILSVHTLGNTTQLWLEGENRPARQLPTGKLPPLLRNLSVAPNGQIVAQGIGENKTLWQIYRLNADGTGITNLVPGGFGIWPALVQNGDVVAYQQLYAANGVNHQQVYTVPLAGGTPRQVWAGEVYVNFILALPDQRHVLAITTDPGGSVNGLVQEIALNGSPPVTVHPREYKSSFGNKYQLTPDGKALTVVRSIGSSGNIWAIPLNGEPYSQITHFPDLEISAYAFAKDGRLAVSRGSENSDAVLATGLVIHGH